MLEFLDEHGYSGDQEEYVCPKCVDDPFLKLALNQQLDRVRCNFCNSRRAAPVTILLEILSDTVRAYYNDAAGELPYESAEGGYIFQTMDTRDILEQLDQWWSADNLLDYVVDQFADVCWCKRDYFGLTRYEALTYGWDVFVRMVKNETRYLFFPEPSEGYSEHSEGVLPQNMLEALRELFTEYKLFRTIALDQTLKRARVIKKGERPSLASELGTAPSDAVSSPNRMSPAGIPMFYGAFRATTAIAETYEPRRGRGREIAIATFRPVKPLRLLDLTSLPPLPSVFDSGQRQHHDPVAFLRGFARDLSKPVRRDGRSHTEYVPTQIVTEFVRHRMRDPEVDGIVYSSSREIGAEAVVVFATQDQCVFRQDRAEWRSEQLLEMIDVEYRTPPRSQRRR